MIAEALLPIEEGQKSLVDYKIWCFNGKAHYIWTCSDRDNQGTEVMTYDRDWNPMPEVCVFDDRYRKGAFGDSVIDKETLIYKRYIDNFSGYETGPKLLLGLGLTTHLSNLPRKFVSNAALKRSFKDKVLNINIVKPRVSLNKGNLRYFQLLDTILMVKTIPVDAQDPIEIYLKYIKTYRLTLARVNNFVVQYYKGNKFLLSVLAGIQERCNTNAIAQK